MIYAGEHVVYVDSAGRGHPALVTAVWRDPSARDDPDPAVNLVLVSPDANRTDPYGRQIERRTRVRHQSRGAGESWRRAHEPAARSLEELVVA